MLKVGEGDLRPSPLNGAEGFNQFRIAGGLALNAHPLVEAT